MENKSKNLNKDQKENEKGDFFQLTSQKADLSSVTEVFDELKLKEKPVIFQKRLNSLDSVMLEDSAYVALDDEDLKLEKRIENTEETIKSIEEQIIVAETIQDVLETNRLQQQKTALMKKLQNLKSQYKDQNLDTRFTTIASNILNFPKNLKREIRKQFKLLFKRSAFVRKYTPIVRSMIMRDTLSRLDKINKSVDLLVKMQVPFGEQEERYQTLANHLAKATFLHSQIEKELRN